MRMDKHISAASIDQGMIKQDWLNAETEEMKKFYSKEYVEKFQNRIANAKAGIEAGQSNFLNHERVRLIAELEVDMKIWIEEKNRNGQN